MLTVVFWACLGMIVYTYAGFPLLVCLRGFACRRAVNSGDAKPSVSIIIAAHNEQESIEAKVHNMLELDYPEPLREIVVASDGSTDATEEIVRTIAEKHHGVQLLALPRQGKAGVLNAAVEKCRGQVLVFTDANSMFERGALKALVRPFADTAVGGVAGDQRYSRGGGASAADAGERSYWNFDRWLKIQESRAGHTISGTGAIYAIRRSLFQKVPEGVTDDFVTSTRVIAQGSRLVFAQDAAAYEPVAATSGIEFGRKVRIITRGLRGVMMMRKLFNPFRYGFYSIQLLSHKLLRRLMVFPLIVLPVVSLLLSGESSLFLVASLVQIGFWTTAAIGGLMKTVGIGAPKFVGLPFYFAMVNLACLVAVGKLITGQRIVLWEPRRCFDGDSVSNGPRPVAGV